MLIARSATRTAAIAPWLGDSGCAPVASRSETLYSTWASSMMQARAAFAAPVPAASLDGQASSRSPSHESPEFGRKLENFSASNFNRSRKGAQGPPPGSLGSYVVWPCCTLTHPPVSQTIVYKKVHVRVASLARLQTSSSIASLEDADSGFQHPHLWVQQGTLVAS